MRKKSHSHAVTARAVVFRRTKSKEQGLPPNGRPFLYKIMFLLYALTTLPDLRQEVQTRTRLDAPFTIARTGRRFTFQRRLLTLWAWLMLFPNCGPLPHTSHTRAILDDSRNRLRRVIQKASELVKSNFTGRGQI